MKVTLEVNSEIQNIISSLLIKIKSVYIAINYSLAYKQLKSYIEVKKYAVTVKLTQVLLIKIPQVYQFLKELFKAQMVISGTSPHFRHSNLVSRIIIYIKHQNKVSVKKGIEIKLTLADPG